MPAARHAGLSPVLCPEARRGQLPAAAKSAQASDLSCAAVVEKFCLFFLYCYE